MQKYLYAVRSIALTVLILVLSFAVGIYIHTIFINSTLAPLIFALACFLVAHITTGYVYGIAASLISAVVVNFAFTYPYFELNFSIPENLFSAFVFLAVAIMTSTMTTKIKRHEKLKSESEAERMRANLLRAISHDLRTPLTSIYGSCSAIIDNYDVIKKEQQLKLLGEISEDAQWLIRMVENLLSVTRIGGDKVSLVKTPTVLEELVDSVLIKFEKRYPSKNVEVTIPDGFVTIPMDALLIEQVIINILENAVRHAKGMTRIKFTVDLQDNTALFTISDNGCGIETEKLRNIFTGYLGNDTQKADRSKGNMNIGLSLCAAIIKAHGGEIWAYNNTDGGASFSFSLITEATENEQ